MRLEESFRQPMAPIWLHHETARISIMATITMAPCPDWGRGGGGARGH
jgi:hypothetical protein